MNKKVVIFGVQDYAELAHYYLNNDSPYHVAAFCVNEQYLPENKLFKELPVVPFENIESIYPAEDFSFSLQCLQTR